MTQRLRLGDMLVQAQMLSTEKLSQALGVQSERGGRLGEILVAEGFVSETQLTQTLSNQLSVPWVSLHHVDFTRALLNRVPRALAERFGLVPVYVRAVRREGDTLFVAMDDPTNEEAIAAVSAAAGLPVRAMVAAPSDIRRAIRAYYGGASLVPPAVPPTPSPATLHERAEAPAGFDSAPSAPAAPAAVPPADEVAVSTRPAPVAASAEAEPSAPLASPSPRMIAITLLDGTSIALPAPVDKRHAEAGPEAPATAEDALTAADLVAALRARATGADVSAVLGDATWEAMFAALLSVLLKKRLIADWEFVEAWQQHRR